VTDKSTLKKGGSLSIPKASATELRGRQSIRVSFKLTRKCIEAMNILGSHLRLKPKSLFDHMVQESQTLEAIAARAQGLSPDNQPRMAKTYVISRDAAEMLDDVARTRNVSRDALVETSVQHLVPLIQKEQVRHTARKNLASRMERHVQGGRELLDDMVAELGEGDPMCDKMRSVMAVYERAFESLSVFIQKGEIIEGFKSRD
jgi:hypothetical protein